MSKQKAAEKYLLENPLASVNEVMEATGASRRTVSRAREELKSERKVTPKEPQGTKEKDTYFKQDSNGAEYSFKTKDRIISKEDLIKACDIDLSQWRIEKWECNKWEVGMKMAAIGGSKEGWARKSDEVIVTPLFQVKLWLKPVHSEKQVNILDAIEDIVKQHVTGKQKSVKKTPVKEVKSIKATLSDMHVGLDPNPNGRSMYNYVYGEKQFNANLDKVLQSLIAERKLHGQFDILVIDDLGDGLDGWNGLTTRGGHKLEQNLNNVEQFRVFVSGKLRFIENAINADIANEIIVRSVTDDNHSGDFAHTANMAIQMILERSYDSKDVKYIILKKFMEHFTYGDHTFILTHGKDKENMFKGLPLELNEKAIKLIEDYIDYHKIKSKYVHLEKGDLHQVAYEKTNRFDYRNYMSFAPPSSYVQNNFGNGYSGYSIQIVKKFGEVSHTDYYFDMRPVK